MVDINAEPKQSLQFEINRNFTLVPTGWGEAVPVDVMKLLDSVLIEFYSVLDQTKISNKKVLVLHNSLKVPFSDEPEIRKTEDFNIIFLTPKDRYWSQYSYQFAHELCHYICDTNFFYSNDKFGWFEETLCELSSIFVMERMALNWREAAPYDNWKSYSNSLHSYVVAILENDENIIDLPFKEWLQSKLENLEKNRYKRIENRIVAINLLQVFKNNFKLWQIIHYLKDIVITDDMNFHMFIDAWKTVLPANLKKSFSLIEEVLL